MAQDLKLTRVVMAADDGYSRPLATAGRSVIRHMSEDRKLELYILDMGISGANRALLEASFRHERVETIWLKDMQSTVAGLPTHSWFTTAAYARLLIPQVLPATVDRVIYMDCDLVVRRCVGALYDAEMNDCIARAVPDMGAAFVCCPWGVAGWMQLGRQPTEFNFNSGVLLMDVEAWRREEIGRVALDYARDYPKLGRVHPLNLDQEALNATAGHRIKPIDPRWNQQGELFQTACAVVLPYSDEVVDELRKDPWIIHYSTSSKPWRFDCPHPWVSEWYSNLDQTAYKGWRPSGPTMIEKGFRKLRSAAGCAGRKARLLSPR